MRDRIEVLKSLCGSLSSRQIDDVCYVIDSADIEYTDEDGEGDLQDDARETLDSLVADFRLYGGNDSKQSAIKEIDLCSLSELDIRNMFKTRNGQPYRILSKSINSDKPVVIAVEEKQTGTEVVFSLQSNGRRFNRTEFYASDCDLVLIHTESPRSGYVAIYDNGAMRFLSSKGEAMGIPKSGCIACVPFSVEFKPGEMPC